MLLLDQGLPRSTVFHLRKLGVEAIHVGEIGLAAADDSIILEHAREHAQIVVTLDADFHMLLASAGASRPSVIRIRIEGLRGDAVAQLLLRILERCREELNHGAVVSVSETGARIRRLPLIR